MFYVENNITLKVYTTMKNYFLWRHLPKRTNYKYGTLFRTKLATKWNITNKIPFLDLFGNINLIGHAIKYSINSFGLNRFHHVTNHVYIFINIQKWYLICKIRIIWSMKTRTVSADKFWYWIIKRLNLYSFVRSFLPSFVCLFLRSSNNK